MNTTQHDDGGPAFPVPGTEYNERYPGMSLRDWFAGQALNGITEAVASARIHCPAQTPDEEHIGRWAVELADATILALKKP